MTNFLLDPKNRPLLAILKGLRNGTLPTPHKDVTTNGISGIVYGIKIRFPHALIMTFLFRSGPYLPPPLQRRPSLTLVPQDEKQIRRNLQIDVSTRP